MPLQELSFVAQSEVPEQVLMPEHLTLPAGGIVGTVGAVVGAAVGAVVAEAEAVGAAGAPLPSTVPFLESHSVWGTSIHPLPAQSFMPSQPLPPEPPAQAEVPLQVLMPAHLTKDCALVPAVAGAGVLESFELQATKRAAMDPAKTAAEPTDLIVTLLMYT
jgi:hypothetical protein